MGWACFEFNGWLDVAPAIEVDGETLMSAIHDPGEHCPCNPRMEWQDKYNWPMWIHNDPDADTVPTKN